MTRVDEVAGRSDASGSPPPGRHFSGFESLRALAALMVVVHHAASISGPASARGLATPAAVMDGGVAVFFVLSGFLIYRPFVASQVAAARAAGAGSSLRWRSFWWRRILRIVPAYWMVLTFFWWLGNFDLGPHWWRYYLFLQIYWPDTVLGGVVQAWSLCTEMSFYLLVPLWAALLSRLSRSWSVEGRLVAHAVACAALWTGGWVARWAVEAWFPSQRGISFNWLPTNLDLFATGMGLAVLSVAAAHRPVLSQRIDRIATSVWPWWLAAFVLFCWYAYGVGATSFEVGYAGWFWHRRQLTFATISLLLLVPAVFGDQARGMLRRWWSARAVVWTGLVSYGLYLWHLDWMERTVDGPSWSGWVGSGPGDASFVLVLAIGTGLGLACAAVSWYCMEKPLQRFKALGMPRPPAARQ